MWLKFMKKKLVAIAAAVVLVVASVIPAFGDTLDWNLYYPYNNRIHTWAQYLYDIGSTAPYDDVAAATNISASIDMEGFVYVRLRASNGQTATMTSARFRDGGFYSDWAIVSGVDYGENINHYVSRTFQGVTTHYDDYIV